MTSPNGHARHRSERIDLADTGDWWEIRAFLTVALDRDFAQIAAESQRLTGPEVDAAFLANLAKMTDALVLRCTTSWSYGEVSEQVLHSEVPAHHYEQVTNRMLELYSPLVLRRIENLLSDSSSPSRAAESSPSPTSSSTAT